MSGRQHRPTTFGISSICISSVISGQTSRQVSTLELRVAPALERQIANLRRTLEEREREEHLRLKHLLKVRKRG